MTKGPFMEFLRNRVKQTIVNTYAEEEIPTPCSNTESLAMLIHQIQCHTDDPQVTEGDYSAITTGLWRKSQSGGLTIEDPDCIFSYGQTMIAGRYEGTLSEYYEYYKDDPIVYFDPPILYAKSVIYHGIGTVQQPAGALKTSDIRIGYTIEKVSKDDFIAALVQ